MKFCDNLKLKLTTSWQIFRSKYWQCSVKFWSQKIALEMCLVIGLCMFLLVIVDTFSWADLWWVSDFMYPKYDYKTDFTITRLFIFSCFGWDSTNELIRLISISESYVKKYNAYCVCYSTLFTWSQNWILIKIFCF